MQFSENCNEWKSNLIEITQKYESMWNSYLRRITTAQYRIVLNPMDVPPILSAFHHAGPKQQNFKRQDVAQVKKAGIAEPAVTEWASRIVFVSAKNGSVRFCFYYRR